MNESKLKVYNEWKDLENLCRLEATLMPPSGSYKVNINRTPKNLKRLESLRIEVRNNLFDLLTPDEQFDLIHSISIY